MQTSFVSLAVICSVILYVDASQATISTRAFIIPYEQIYCPYSDNANGRFMLHIAFNTTNTDDKVTFITMTTARTAATCLGVITDPFRIDNIISSFSAINKSYSVIEQYIDNSDNYLCFVFINEEYHPVTINYNITAGCDITTKLNLTWLYVMLSVFFVMFLIVYFCNDTFKSWAR
ncbi:MAG: hypothetical protein Faunusvirus4_3 [Faunusvirus sp.]|jgi:hypothetical protein|uniref:Uncharacterized protein n=1 Tax=Faunusvirus sp. TaxID=2487766 RepID=A0A3G4ZW70_9VIRU|nr:MAG: hypothetical protein Faunusvirus4_3 [Faunusvirus sp.]